MGQLRKQAKALSARVKEGDAAAAELLSHSVKLGHGKLAVRRFLLAQAMGATVPKDDAAHCVAVLDHLPCGVIETMEKEEGQKARRYMKRTKSDG